MPIGFTESVRTQITGVVTHTLPLLSTISQRGSKSPKSVERRGESNDMICCVGVLYGRERDNRVFGVQGVFIDGWLWGGVAAGDSSWWRDVGGDCDSTNSFSAIAGRKAGERNCVEYRARITGLGGGGAVTLNSNGANIGGSAHGPRSAHPWYAT